MKYYHYTTRVQLEQIMESEVIKLATAGLPKSEKAIAWVSSNQHWEQTASKGMTDFKGNNRWLTFEEQLDNFGCARIQIEPDCLIPWRKLKHLSKMHPLLANSLEDIGYEKGANPSDWYGSLSPIGINDWIKAEVYKNGEWVEYEVFEEYELEMAA